MGNDRDFIGKTYDNLKTAYGDDVGITEQELRDRLAKEKDFAGKVYQNLHTAYGDDVGIDSTAFVDKINESLKKKVGSNPSSSAAPSISQANSPIAPFYDTRLDAGDGVLKSPEQLQEDKKQLTASVATPSRPKDGPYSVDVINAPSSQYAPNENTIKVGHDERHVAENIDKIKSILDATPNWSEQRTPEQNANMHDFLKQKGFDDAEIENAFIQQDQIVNDKKRKDLALNNKIEEGNSIIKDLKAQGFVDQNEKIKQQINTDANDLVSKFPDLADVVQQTVKHFNSETTDLTAASSYANNEPKELNQLAKEANTQAKVDEYKFRLEKYQAYEKFAEKLQNAPAEDKSNSLDKAVLDVMNNKRNLFGLSRLSPLEAKRYELLQQADQIYAKQKDGALTLEEQKKAQQLVDRAKLLKTSDADLLYDPATGQRGPATKTAVAYQQGVELLSRKYNQPTYKDKLQSIRNDQYDKVQAIESQIKQGEDYMLQLEKSQISNPNSIAAANIKNQQAVLDKLNADKTQELMSFDAVNKVLMLNENPGTVRENDLQQFGNRMKAAVMKEVDPGQYLGAHLDQKEYYEQTKAMMEKGGPEMVPDEMKKKFVESVAGELGRNTGGIVGVMPKFILAGLLTEGASNMIGLGNFVEKLKSTGDVLDKFTAFVIDGSVEATKFNLTNLVSDTKMNPISAVGFVIPGYLGEGLRFIPKNKIGAILLPAIEDIGKKAIGGTAAMELGGGIESVATALSNNEDISYELKKHFGPDLSSFQKKVLLDFVANTLIAAPGTLADKSKSPFSSPTTLRKVADEMEADAKKAVPGSVHYNGEKRTADGWVTPGERTVVTKPEDLTDVPAQQQKYIYNKLKAAKDLRDRADLIEFGGDKPRAIKDEKIYDENGNEIKLKKIAETEARINREQENQPNKPEPPAPVTPENVPHVDERTVEAGVGKRFDYGGVTGTLHINEDGIPFLIHDDGERTLIEGGSSGKNIGELGLKEIDDANPRAKLELAKLLDSQGKKDIPLITGWEKTDDGKWRVYDAKRTAKENEAKAAAEKARVEEVHKKATELPPIEASGENINIKLTEGQIQAQKDHEESLRIKAQNAERDRINDENNKLANQEPSNKETGLFRVHVGNPDLYDSDKIDSEGYVYFDSEKDANDFEEQVRKKTGEFLSVEKVEPKPSEHPAEQPDYPIAGTKEVGQYRPEAAKEIISEGNKTVINFADGDKHKAVYVVAPISSVLPSHHPLAFHKTKGYPVDEKGNSTNDRNYEADKAAQGTVAKYSNKPDPEALLDTSTYTMTGPPMITNDLFVVGGNNRQMVLMNMSKDAYKEYYDLLKDRADTLGVEIPEYDDANRIALYRKDNEAAQYSKANSAKYNKEVGKEKDEADEMISFASALKDHPLSIESIANEIGNHETFSSFFGSRKSVKEVRDILLKYGVIDEKGLNKLFDADGMFTAQGKMRFRNGLFATMFDEDIVRLWDSEGVTKFVDKIESALPVITANFRLGDEKSLKHEIQEAIKLQTVFASWKRERMKEAREGAKDNLTMLDYIKAVNLFDVPNIHAVRMWYLIDKSSVNNNYFKNLLLSYNNSASDKGAINMFEEDAPKTKDDFLELLKKYLPDEDNKIIENALLNEEAAPPDAGGIKPVGGGSAEKKDSGPKEYEYHLTLRPIGLSTYPKDNFVRWEDDGTQYGKLIYSKPVPIKDAEHFSLDPITQAKELDNKFLQIKGTNYEWHVELKTNQRGRYYLHLVQYRDGAEVDSEDMTVNEVLRNIENGRYIVNDGPNFGQQDQEVQGDEIQPPDAPEPDKPIQDKNIDKGLNDMLDILGVDEPATQYKINFEDNDDVKNTTGPDKTDIKYQSALGLGDSEFSKVKGIWTKSGEFDFTGALEVKTHGDVAFIMRLLESKGVEHAFAVHVDKDGKSHVQFLSMGDSTSTIIDPKMVVAGVERFGSKSIYLVHNHPSGNLTPSDADKALTTRLREALFSYGVIPLQHVIMDTLKGEYTVINDFDHTYEEKRSTTGDANKLEVHKYDKLEWENIEHLPGFAQGDIKISQSSDAAQLINNFRFSINDKFGVLILDNRNHVIGNYRLNNSDGIGLSKEIAGLVVKHHGKAAIMYTNKPITFKEGVPDEVKYIKKQLEKTAIKLLDYVSVQSSKTVIDNYKHISAADEGVMEPDSKYSWKLKEPKELTDEEKKKLRDVAEKLIGDMVKHTTDFTEMVDDLHKRIGDKVEKLLPALKQAYAAYREGAPQEVYDKMNSRPRDFNFEQFSSISAPGVNKLTNTTGTPASPRNTFNIVQRVQDIYDKYNVPLAQGTLKKRNLGVYKLHPKKVRVQSLTDFYTAMHELTHAIDRRHGITEAIMQNQAVVDILKQAYKDEYPAPKKKASVELQVTEGLAMLLEQALFDPRATKQLYGLAYDEILDPSGSLFNQELSDAHNDFIDLAKDYQQAHPGDVIRSRQAYNNTKQSKGIPAARQLEYELVNRVAFGDHIDALTGNTYKSNGIINHWTYYNQIQAIASNWVKKPLGITAKPQIYIGNGEWGPTSNGYRWEDYMKLLKTDEDVMAFNDYLVARRLHFEFEKAKELEDMIQQGLATPDDIEEFRKVTDIINKNAFTQEVADAVYDEGKARFAAAEKIYDGINSNLIDHMENTGLIKPELADKFRNEPGYASFKRWFEDSMLDKQGDATTFTSLNKGKVSTLKAYHGSEKMILPPTYNQVLSINEILHKGAANLVYKAVAEAALSNSEIAREFFEPVSMADIGMRPGDPVPKGIVRVYIKGVQKFFKTNQESQQFFEALTPEQQVHVINQAQRVAANIFKTSTTGLYAFFGLINLSVDAVTRFMNTKTGLIPVIHDAPTVAKMIYAGFMSMLGKEGANNFATYMAQGGRKNLMTADWQISPLATMNDILGRGNKAKTIARNVIEVAMDILSLPTNFTEMMGRFTEYDRALKAGHPHNVAMRMASDVSVNFSKHGNMGGSRGQEWVKGVPYMNPAIRAIISMSKAMKENKGRSIIAIYALTAIAGAFAYFLLHDSDDDEKNELMNQPIEELGRWLYFPARWVGGRQGTLIKIRIPEQVGVFTGAATMLMCQLYGNKKWHADDWVTMGLNPLPNQLRLNHPVQAAASSVPQLYKPLGEVALNTKFYPSMMPIVNQKLSDRLPQDQYDSYTSEFAKDAGNMLGWSPKKIDFYVREQFGRTASLVIGMADVLRTPELRAKVHGIPSFLRETRTYIPVYQDYERYLFSGNAINNFYQLKEAQQQTVNSLKFNDSPLFKLNNDILHQMNLVSEKMKGMSDNPTDEEKVWLYNTMNGIYNEGIDWFYNPKHETSEVEHKMELLKKKQSTIMDRINKKINQ